MKTQDLNSYELSRAFWNWAFDNPEKVKPTHSAIYFFAVELCNRLGWKKKFGFPTTMVMEAVGIKSYGTYIKTFNELVDFGFFELIERSKNQYSSNIISLRALSKNVKALDKALVKHTSKQVQSTHQSTVSIDKQVNNITNKQINNITSEEELFESIIENFEVNKDMAKVVIDWLEYKKERKETYKSDRSIKSFITKLQNLSGNDSAIAREIIEQSFANNYAGVFELKNKSNVSPTETPVRRVFI